MEGDGDGDGDLAWAGPVPCMQAQSIKTSLMRRKGGPFNADSITLTTEVPGRGNIERHQVKICHNFTLTSVADMSSASLILSQLVESLQADITHRRRRARVDYSLLQRIIRYHKSYLGELSRQQPESDYALAGPCDDIDLIANEFDQICKVDLSIDPLTDYVRKIKSAKECLSNRFDLEVGKAASLLLLAPAETSIEGTDQAAERLLTGSLLPFSEQQVDDTETELIPTKAETDAFDHFKKVAEAETARIIQEKKDELDKHARALEESAQKDHRDVDVSIRNAATEAIKSIDASAERAISGVGRIDDRMTRSLLDIDQQQQEIAKEAFIAMNEAIKTIEQSHTFLKKVMDTSERSAVEARERRAAESERDRGTQRDLVTRHEAALGSVVEATNAFGSRARDAIHGIDKSLAEAKLEIAEKRSAAVKAIAGLARAGVSSTSASTTDSPSTRTDSSLRIDALEHQMNRIEDGTTYIKSTLASLVKQIAQTNDPSYHHLPLSTAAPPSIIAKPEHRATPSSMTDRASDVATDAARLLQSSSPIVDALEESWEDDSSCSCPCGPCQRL